MKSGQVLIGICAAGVGGAAEWPLRSLLGTRSPALMLYPAVILAALFAGPYAGISAAVGAACILEYVYFPPYFSFRLEHAGDLIPVSVFLAIGATISVFGERFRRRGQKLAKLGAIVMTSDDAIVGTTLEGVIDSWNAGAQRLFGYTASEIVGRPLSDLGPPERKFEEMETLRRVRAGEEVAHFDTVRLTKEQRLIDVSVTASVVLDERGKAIGFSNIARDITDRKRAMSELGAAKEAAESAARARARFLDIAAHELRSPVTAMCISLQFAHMQLQKGHPVEVPTLEGLRKQADRLSRLVVELLDVARLDRGRLKLVPALTDLVALASDCVNACRLRAPARRFVVLAPEYPVDVFVDPVRMYQVVSNLLENAVDYTPAATPIEVIVEGTGDRATVSVRDHGPGMDARQQAELFLPFTRGSSGREESVHGLGLGLYLSRQLTELHRGTIRVSSKLGAGSTFTVELPMAAWARKAEREGSFQSQENLGR